MSKKIYRSGLSVLTAIFLFGSFLLPAEAVNNYGSSTYGSGLYAATDATVPVITLLGSNSVSINQNQTYSDAGATANDAFDGNLTSSITTVNPVNTVVAGTYTITYNVSDVAGNSAAQVTRTVNVLSVGSVSAASYQTPAQLVAGSDEGGTAAALTINNNASFTTANRLVTLKFNNFGNPLISHLAISTSPDFAQSPLIGYVPEYSYDLCGNNTDCPDGQYTVYARYYTDQGQSSPAAPLVINLKKGAATTPSTSESQAATVSAAVPNALASRLAGRILLQVESHGEAWYVNPDNKSRYYLGRPVDAYNLMRDFGLGATDKDINLFKSSSAPRRLSGKILLQVQDKGQAYYINPVNLKLYYLGRPADAYNLMRAIGLGITDENLEQISENQN